MNETINSIKNHRSIRTYLDKEIPNEIINEILKSAQAMPTSINAQQVSVIVVKDSETKRKISELAGGQPWIANSPVFMVFVVDFYKTYLAGEKADNKQVIHESVEGTLVGTFDAGLAMGAAIISAESLGLGIVPIGGIRNSPKEMIEILGLPQFTFPVAGLCIGYPENISKQKPRLPFETFAHNEVYKTEGIEEHINNYDDLLGQFLIDANREKEVNWSFNTSNIYKYVYFPKVYPTMKTQGFNNDK